MSAFRKPQTAAGAQARIPEGAVERAAPRLPHQLHQFEVDE